MVKGMGSTDNGVRGDVSRQGGERISQPRILGIEKDSLVEAHTGYENGILRALIKGVPRWTDKELCTLAAGSGHAQALLTGYRKHGADVFRYLEGAFFGLISDEGAGRLLLAIDRLGIHTAFFSEVGKTLVFGERADVVASHPEVGENISPQGICNYLYFHMVPGPGSIFNGASRLVPGQVLDASVAGVKVLPYWQPHYDSSSAGQTEDELKEEFLNLVNTAVRGSVEESTGVVGAFLSGGTDSSTVAGMLSKIRPGEARTYSIGFDAPGYDEMEYARIASKRFGTEHHKYYVTPDDVTQAVPRIAAFMDQPFGNASVVPGYYCAQMAKDDGVDCLLAGDGGDELFGGNYRYAKQKMFEAYSQVPGLLRKGLIEPLLLHSPGVGTLPGFRKLKSYVTQANVPMPERMESYNLLKRLGADRILSEDWYVQADTGEPMHLIHDCYHEVSAENLIDRMLAVDMRFTLADSDLPKVNHACQLAGIDVRYPWLDQRLVDFAATLPSDPLPGRRNQHR